MSVLFIRYFFLIFCAFYSHTKLLNPKTSINAHSRHYTLFSILLSTSIPFLTPNYTSTFRFSIIFICHIIFIILYFKTNILQTTTLALISYTLSYLSLSISAFILSIIATISTEIVILHNLNFVLIGGLLQYVIIFWLFRIKRLQSGMPFLLNNTTFNLGLCICAIVIFYNEILRHTLSFSWKTQFIFIIIIPLLAIALLIWWRYKITQSYVEKLRVDEVELLYKEISDKDLEIEKLHAHNEDLARIIHKDNKLIPAMELAVRNYLQTAPLMKPEDAWQMGSELLAKLERMTEERTGILHTYQETHSYHQKSGLTLIDAIIELMENRARTFGIEYHYQYDKAIKKMLPAFITEDDAMHLLSDVIDNAIIAVTHSEKKNINIHIGIIRGILFMDISDSGIPFSPETYQKFGTTKHTTHEEDGGSGIGLMDIANLKKQYKFSLQIYEYPETEPVYTKKIRILFDRKNHYLIQSHRAKEISSIIIRNDLHVLPCTDNEKSISTSKEKSERSI